MTIETTEFVKTYDGDGVTVDFTYDKPFDALSDLLAFIRNAEGVRRSPAFTAAESGSGATVTITSETPPVGEKVILERRTALLQGTNYSAGNFPSEAHERTADRLTMAAQERQSVEDRTLRVGPDAAAIPPLPDLAENHALIKTAEGFGQGPGVDEISGAQGYAEAAGTSAGAAASSAAAAASSAGDAASSAGDAAELVQHFRDDVAALVADTEFTYAGAGTVVAAGFTVFLYAEGWAYEVAAAAATDHHLTTAGGVKLYFRADGQTEIPVAAFLFNSSRSAAQNTAAFNAARDLAISTSIRTLRFPADSGTIRVAQLDLPTFTVSDASQEPQNMIRLLGAGQINTHIALMDADVTSAYVIGHASAGTIADRAQNSFVEIGYMQVTRKGVVGSNLPVIQIDNTWAPHIHDVIAYGNLGGATIDVYSNNRGGSQTGTFERIRDWKHQQWDAVASPAEHDVDVLRARGSRYMFHFRGPMDAVGKANNNVVRDCEAYYCAMGVVDTVPYEQYPPADYAGTIFPDGGGYDWLRLEGVFGGFEGFSKTETGTFAAVGSQTTPQLKAGGLNRTADDFKDMICRAHDSAAGYVYSRRITAMAADGTLTLASAFPFTIDTATEYEIAYADAQHWSEGGHAGIRPHLLRHSSRIYRSHMQSCRVEEGALAVSMSYARGAQLSIIECDSWSDRSEGLMVFDSAGERPDYWYPATYVGDQARGGHAANAHLITQTMMLARADNLNHYPVILFDKKNTLGADIPSSTFVRLGSNMQDLKAPVSHYAGTWTPHALAYNYNGLACADGDLCSLVLSGVLQVPIYVAADQNVAIGDAVVAQAYGSSLNVGAMILGAGSIAVADQPRVLGRMMQPLDNTGQSARIATLWMRIAFMSMG